MHDAARRNLPQSGNRVLKKFLRNQVGSVLPILATGILIVMALIGGGVDMARGYKAERRLQAACDAAVLAGRRAVTTNGLDTAAKTQAQNYFNANFDSTEVGTKNVVFTPSSPDGGDTVKGIATAKLPVLVMAVFDFKAMNLSVSCSAQMGIGNADIMFVLDNTASMNWQPSSDSNPSDPNNSRIAGLRTAMKAFYDTVKTSTAGGNARVRYGFVPYATTVNVGALLRGVDSNYIADSITVPSVKLVNWKSTPLNSWSDNNPTYTSSSTAVNWADTGSPYSSGTNCSNSLPNPNPTAWSNYGAEFVNTTTYSVMTNNGHQLKAMGMRQEQRRNEYRCTGNNNKQKQVRTLSRYQQTIDYEEREVNVTASANTTTGDGVTHNQTFADAVLQNRTFSTTTYKTGGSTTIPVDITDSSTLKSKYDKTTTWAGCIKERQTTPAASFSFVSLLTGINPGEATDLDIDGKPTSDAATKWSPLWPEITYERDTGNAFQGIADADASISRSGIQNKEASTYCPIASKLFATMTESQFDAYVDSMNVNNFGTYHDTGLLWGARLSSPTGIFAGTVNAKPTNGGTVSRHMIFMTDGDLAPFANVNGMYGIEEVEMRVTGDGDFDKQEPRRKSRALAICEAIKARGIRLWVIAFGHGVDDYATLQTCASPDSAFKAADSASLNTHFQEIANQVGELRVTQ
jgi:Flp pilus assembly protein TadG